MEKEIRTFHRGYRIEYYECEDGLYKLVIYDLKGVVHDPRLFMDCDTEGSMAINLTWDEVQELFTAVKYREYLWYTYHQFKTPCGVYTVLVIKRINGTYDLAIIDDKNVYRDPMEFRWCVTTGSQAVNLTDEDVKAFFDAVKNHNAN